MKAFDNTWNMSVWKRSATVIGKGGAFIRGKLARITNTIRNGVGTNG